MQDKKLIDAAQHQEARPIFAAGPLLSELLSDPIMHMLMAADRVEYRDLEAVLQRARRPSQRLFGPWLHRRRHRILIPLWVAERATRAISCVAPGSHRRPSAETHRG